MSDKSKGVSRRSFLQKTGAGLVGLSAVNYNALARGVSSPRAGAAEKIVIGMIGVGGMGKNRLRGFLAHDEVEIGAICDVDTRHIDEAVGMVQEKRGRKPKTYRDFRRLLEAPDIDAVAVVTPDHWHALPTVRACEAGKDVFVEKPLSYSIGEGRAMVKAANRYNRVTQMGNHIHNDLDNYRRVVERIQSGQLGKVTRVHVWKGSGTENRGNPPNQQPPKELDYDLWLGPAPKRRYNPLRSHFTYRYFWDYSGGDFIDFWCHISDVAFWALDLKAPKSVSVMGGQYFVDDATETPDSLEAQFEFPGLNYTFSLHPGPLPGLEHMGGIGCVFEGTKATLVTNYGEHEVYVDGKKVEEMPEPDTHIPNSPGHLQEFLDGVKSRNMDTTCNVRYGHQLTKSGLLANISYRTGARLEWDDKAEQVVGNYEANRLVMREYRRPWKL